MNKVDTRVTLLFDLDGSPSLSPEQRDLLHECLSGRISKGGILRVVSQRHRTQMANREAAVARFVQLVREALVVEKPRVPVTIPPSVNERRLEEKRRRKRTKKERTVDLTYED